MKINKDKYSIDNTDYTVGQDNIQKWGFDIHNSVFGISAGLIATFLIFGRFEMADYRRFWQSIYVVCEFFRALLYRINFISLR